MGLSSFFIHNVRDGVHRKSYFNARNKKHPTIVVPSLVSERGKQRQGDHLQVRDQTDLYNEFEVSKGCIERAYII